MILDELINQQDPIEVYIQACHDYQIHPFNTVIEGLKTNALDLSEMSIDDIDLKAIGLALRVDIYFTWDSNVWIIIDSYEIKIDLFEE